ncbi:MAG: hypothetical protein ACI395_08360 [Candidatus Cryptobacteroides sp.]
MKKIFTILAVCLCTVSCVFSSGDNGSGTDSRYNLINYSDILVDKSVLVPLDITKTAILFDEYLALPEDEKMNCDTIIPESVVEAADGVYSLTASFGRHYVSCVVDTENKSIHDPDAGWEISCSEVDAPGLHYGYYRSEELRVVLSKNGTGDEWTMTMKDIVIDLKRLAPSASGLQRWEVKTEGKEVSKEDKTLFAEFASDGYLAVSEYIRSEDYGDVKPVRNYLSGTFSMKTFKETRQLDYCIATYKPGFQTIYGTSRD